MEPSNLSLRTFNGSRWYERDAVLTLNKKEDWNCITILSLVFTFNTILSQTRILRLADRLPHFLYTFIGIGRNLLSPNTITLTDQILILVFLE